MLRRPVESAQDTPGTISAATGGFAQAELADQVLRGARRDAELGGNQRGRGDRPAHDEIDELRQL